MSELAVDHSEASAGGPRGLLRALMTRLDLKTRLSLSIGLLLGVVLLLAVYAVLGNSKRAVQGEIDAILEGRPVAPMMTDNHPMFINAYKKLLYNPYVRTQSEITQAVIALMMERISMEQQLDPMLKAILRGEQMPPAGAQGQPAAELPGQTATELTESAAKPSAPAEEAAPML